MKTTAHFPPPTRFAAQAAGIAAALGLTAHLGMAAGLIGWWNFEKDLLDTSGHGLSGSQLGTPTYQANPPEGLMSTQSIRFDQDSDGVRISAAATLNAPYFTLGYFINLLGAPSANSGLERLTSRQAWAFETAVGNAAAIGGTSSPSGTTLSYYSGSTGWVATHVEVPPDGWLHVAWQNSATKMKLFLNGELAYTGKAVTSAISGFMNIGNAMNNGEGFDGAMDDVFL